MTVKIRFGEEKDARALAELAMIIVRQMELPLVAEIGDTETTTLLERAIKIPGYRYFYGRALVATVDGVVAGTAFGYPEEDEPVIDFAFGELLDEFGRAGENLFTDSEVVGEEFYLDTIAVSPDYRGHGIGTKLLATLPELAKSFGKSVIGLNVDDANPKAKKLYERVGFHGVKKIKISGHDYLHMYWEI